MYSVWGIRNYACDYCGSVLCNGSVLLKDRYTTPVPLTFGELETLILAVQIAGQTDKVTEDALLEKLRSYQQKAWDAK